MKTWFYFSVKKKCRKNMEHKKKPQIFRTELLAYWPSEKALNAFKSFTSINKLR